MTYPKNFPFLLTSSLLAMLSPAVVIAQEQTPVTLPEVVVEGKQLVLPGVYNSKVISLPKYTGALLDTPQSATVVPKQVIQDTGSTTLRDVLHNVSGISMAAGEGGAQGDSLTIRGFTARTDIFLDGLRSAGNFSRDPFNLEQVEVLKGPAATSFGRGSTGGVVNQESKKPQLDPVTTAELTGGSDNTRRATMDVNRQVPNVAPNTYFRLNMMSHDSDVAGRRSVENHRYGFAPSLGLGIGTSERTILSYFKQVNNDIPDYGIPYLWDRVAPVNRTNFYGFKNANYLRTNVDVYSISYEKDFDATLTGRQNLRYGTYGRNVQVTGARVPTTVTPGTDINTINVTRNQIGARSKETSLQYDLNFLKKIDGETFKHALTFGVEATRETSDPTRFSYTGVPNTSLVNPQDSEFSGTISVNTVTDVKVTTLAAYISDTIKLSEKWEWTEQLRFDYLESSSEQWLPTYAYRDRVDNQMLSSRGGLVYKPVPEGSIYLTYSTSFNPSAEQFSLSAANANAEPEKNRTYELGTKWNLLGGGLMLSSAVFLNEKVNARTPDPNDPTVNILSGEQKVQGFEVEASGSINPKWQIFAGYTYADSEITESNIATEKGSRLANAPLNSGSIWTTYMLTGRWQLGAGIKGVSERIASTTPDVASGLVKKAEGYHVLDAMAQYWYSNEINYRLNVYNLDDKFYVDGVQANHTLIGAGRSAQLTATLKF